MDEKRQLLRHTVAALAYRAGKALKGMPPDADIVMGRVGPWQSEPRKEFD